jgi:excisionase family DNA binding protein
MLNPELMTLSEVAEYLRMSRTTVYRLVQSGKIPGVKIASQWRFRKQTLERWMDAQLEGEPADPPTELPVDSNSVES